jgi:hypothetical protein
VSIENSKDSLVGFLTRQSTSLFLNTPADDGLVDRDQVKPVPKLLHSPGVNFSQSARTLLSRSEHIPHSQSMMRPSQSSLQVSITGRRLDMEWRQLRQVEYLTDGGNSWIHTAILDDKPVVANTIPNNTDTNFIFY